MSELLSNVVEFQFETLTYISIGSISRELVSVSFKLNLGTGGLMVLLFIFILVETVK